MPAKPYSWSYSLPAALLLMSPFDILASLAMDIYLPVLPAMPSALDTGPELVQLTLTVYIVVLGLGQVLFGPLSDRIGRRPVLLGGALLFAISSFGLATVDTALAFIGLRLLQAAGASAALVATFATVRDVYAHRPEGTTIYGLFSAMLAFVPALGPVAGALIAGTFGWRAIFVSLGVLGLTACLHAVLRWPETRPLQPDNRRRSFAALFASSSFWTYTLGFSAAMGSFFVFFSTAPRVLVERAGLSELAFSLGFASVAVVMIVASRFAGGLVGRWGIPASLRRAMAVLLASAVLLALGKVFGLHPLLGFLLPMWLMASGIVLAVSVTANGALAGFDDMAGAAVAVYFCVQSLITGVLGTLLVVLLPGDTAWPLVAFSAAMALAVRMALALRG
jgi:MFS transporter, DHA1 family, chloramphenicol/florfenicol resistance protein